MSGILSTSDWLSQDSRTMAVITCVFGISVLWSMCMGFVLDSVTSKPHVVNQHQLYNSKYTGNGETPYYWRQNAKMELQRALTNQPIVGVAKNTIFFLGDGMGTPTVTAARILKGQMKNKTGEEEQLSFDKFPHVALSKTYNQDHQTPDSAGTATAYLAGVKTNMGVIGVDASVKRGNCQSQQGHEVQSILDWSLAAGKSVGIITTTRITHATPAGAYAHVASRSWEGDHYTQNIGGCKDIALQLIEDNPNIQVIMGGGRRFFLPYNVDDPEHGSNAHYGRRDGRNLIEQWQRDKVQRGMTHAYVWNQTAFDNVDPSNTDYLLGLFEYSHMQYELDRKDPRYEVAGEPSISEMTEKAIKILQRNPNGYFLLVEGGRIDLAHHYSETDKALHDTVAFSDAVGNADQMTNNNDTLIIVTADHSHTMMISGYPSRGNDILGLVDDGHGGYYLADDHKPYTTLMYGNGPNGLETNRNRDDLTYINTDGKEFIFPAGVPLDLETHGGEDVGIFARGPMAHLFHGVHEQNYIAHVMAYASCVGEYSTPDSCAASLSKH